MDGLLEAGGDILGDIEKKEQWATRSYAFNLRIRTSDSKAKFYLFQIFLKLAQEPPAKHEYQLQLASLQTTRKHFWRHN